MMGKVLSLAVLLSICVAARTSPSPSLELQASDQHRARLDSSLDDADLEEFRKQNEVQMQHALMRHSARAAVSASQMTVSGKTLDVFIEEIPLHRYDVLANIIGAILYLSNPAVVVIVPTFAQYLIATHLPSLVQTLADAYVANNETVVITVNWNNVVPAGTMNYYQIVIYALAVARELATLIVNIQTTLAGQNITMPTKLLHFVGFDLGAQIAGIVGGMLQGVGKITALDPAGPYFSDVGRDPKEFLNKKSADFVEIFHTNGGSLLSGALSFFEPVGHNDVYVNGGSFQPGCISQVFSSVGNVINYLLSGEWSRNLCARQRSVEVFTEALLSKQKASAFVCGSFKAFKNGECLRNTRISIGNNKDKYEEPTGCCFFSTSVASPYLTDAFEVVVQPANPVGNIVISLLATAPGGYTFKIPNIVHAVDQGQPEILGMVLAPLGTDVNDLNLTVRYEKPFWCFWCPSKVEIKQVIVTKTDQPVYDSQFAFFQCGLWLASNFNLTLLLTGMSPCTA